MSSLERELVENTRVFMNQFNEIPLSVYEICADKYGSCLSEFSVNSAIDYPTYHLLFRYKFDRNIVEAAQSAGFVVIVNAPEFEGVTLGVASSGYSFVGAH